MRFSTKTVHGHDYYDERFGVFIPPIYMTTIFEQPDRATGETRITDRGTELKYSREENPTVRAFEKLMAKLEEAEDALAFSSGMASISCLYIGILEADSKIIIPMEAYGTSIQLLLHLGKFGVKTVKVWPSTESVVEAVDKSTRLILVETLSNPTLKVLDIREIAKVAEECGSILVVDNTFATPVIYNPLIDGAKIVVHSTTKYIGGHNDVLGGIIASNKETILELWDWRRKLGSIMTPMQAYLNLRGVKTLEVRFEKQSKTALEIAEFLLEHPAVEEVLYPGLTCSPYHEVASKIFKKNLYGSVIAFKVRGGRSRVIRVIRNIRLIKASPSLGGTESLLAYPVISAAKTIPEEDRLKLGITDNLLRLSVGLENPEDLKEDLDQALGG